MELKDRKDLIGFRDYDPKSDEGFLYTTWLNGLYYGSDTVKKFFDVIDISQNEFFEKYRKIIKIILSCESVKIRLAVLAKDPDIILGYSVSDIIQGEPTIHYVFVKEAWRKMGLARELVPKDIKRCTHLTKVGKSIKPKEWVYSPFFT